MSAVSLITPSQRPHPPSPIPPPSLPRYPPRLGRCADAPPPRAGVRLPPHGPPGLVRAPPVLPAADHAGLPLRSRSAAHPTSLRAPPFEADDIMLRVLLGPNLNKKTKKREEREMKEREGETLWIFFHPAPLLLLQLPCPLFSAAQHDTLIVPRQLHVWSRLNIVLRLEILCSREIVFYLFIYFPFSRRPTGRTIEASGNPRLAFGVRGWGGGGWREGGEVVVVLGGREGESGRERSKEDEVGTRAREAHGMKY